MANYALSEAEFRNNRAMWDLMNEYNTPAAQMQRFKDAGLNPNLVYSQASSGNASSPVSYKAPQVNFTPKASKTEQFNRKLDGILQIVGAVNNLTQNIGQMYDTSLNIGLKQNQLYRSNFDLATLRYAFPGAGYSTKDFGPSHFTNFDQINPLSPDFDPAMYRAASLSGQLPQFYNQYLTADQQRELTTFRSKYQEYYNANILPKFNEYQQGKIDLQQFEKSLNEYSENARNMVPSWLRGILDPLFHYLGPMIKMIFKDVRVH